MTGDSTPEHEVPVQAGVPPPKRSWVTDTLIAAVLPLISFGVAFSYEEGYCAAFRIPKGLISLGGSHVLDACMAVVAVASVVFLCWISFRKAFQNLPAPFRGPLSGTGVGILLWIGVLFAYGGQPSKHLWMLGFVLLPAILHILLAVIRYGRVPGLAAKIEAQDQFEQTVEGPATPVMRRFGPEVFVGSLVFLWSILIANAAGDGAAVRQRKFFVVGSAPRRVILRMYGDLCVCAELTNERGKIAPEITVVEVRQLGGPLREEECGPLSFADRP